MRVSDVFRRFGYDPDHPIGRDHDIPLRLVNELGATPVIDEELLSRAGRQSRTVSPLSGRERDVLRCRSHGLNAPMTAETLGIGLETVYTHLGTARLKLGAKDSTHAVALALRQHLID